MTHHDESSGHIVLNDDDDESPFCPERSPFSVVMAAFAMGAMTFFEGPFLSWASCCHGAQHFSKPRPSKWDDVAAQGWAQKPAKCPSPGVDTGMMPV